MPAVRSELRGARWPCADRTGSSESRLFQPAARPLHGSQRCGRRRPPDSTRFLWSDDPADWRTIPGNALLTTCSFTRPRPEVILLHSGRIATVTMLPELVARYRAAGYRFVTVGTLLRSAAVTDLNRPAKNFARRGHLTDRGGNPSAAERFYPRMAFLKTLFDGNERELVRLRRTVERVNALEPSAAALSDEGLRAKTDEFKARIEAGESLDDLLPEAFAIVRETSKRVLGMRHFDVQIMGGHALHEGNVAEMRTGEGKTLVATLPVYLNALTGKGVPSRHCQRLPGQARRGMDGPLYYRARTDDRHHPARSRTAGAQGRL